MRCFWSAPELTSIFQDRIVHCVLDLSMTWMRLRYTSPGCRAFRGKPRGITVKFYWKTIKDLELAWIKPSNQWPGSANGTLYRDSAVLQFLHLLSERGIAGGVKVFHGFGADPWGLELDEVEKLEQLKFKSKRVLLLFWYHKLYQFSFFLLQICNSTRICKVIVARIKACIFPVYKCTSISNTYPGQSVGR